MSKNKISVILAHPDKNSFNHAIALKVIKTLKNNKYYIFYHDLYQEKYDPVLTKQEIMEESPVPDRILIYCREIKDSDGIIIIHPNWWGQPPAILKGWIDRVMRPGIAYKFIEGDLGDGIPVGLLKAKIGIVFNTSNTPEERELAVFGDPLELLWKKCIFELCGVEKFYRKMYCCIITSTPEQRKKWLLEIESMINRYFPEM
jgi:NAD(P)H dehydrogenase (quinone)